MKHHVHFWIREKVFNKKKKATKKKVPPAVFSLSLITFTAFCCPILFEMCDQIELI